MRPGQVPDVWPDVAMMLADALARGDDATTLPEVRQSLESGRCMLWLVTHDEEIVAALVSHIAEERHAFVVWLLGGWDMAAWAGDVSPLLARYARENDLRRVEAYVRPGMTKILRGLDWRHVQSVVALEV